MTGRVRRRSCAPPFLRDFVRWRPDISRRRSRSPPSLRDFVRCRSDISRRRSCAPPSLGDFVAVAPTSPVGGPAHLLLSEISFAVAPTSPVGCPARLLLSEISSLALRHLPPPAAGRCKPKKKISVQVNLTLIFFFGLRREGDSNS